jgi:RNA polymerase sigma-32 factor
MSLPVVADSLNTYLAEVNHYPLLSIEDEKRLTLRYYETQDLDAAQRLVTANLRFVVKIAMDYKSYGVNLRDLIQEGNIGLMTAIKKFDPSKGCRLITYASWWIKSFIQEHILKARGAVKRGARALKKRLFYKEDSLTSENDNTLADPALLDFSLDAAINEDSGGETSHLEMLTDSSASLEDQTANKEEHALVKKDIGSALALLNERERYIIETRTMSDEPKSLQGLGTEFGVSRERVRQIESSALKKLKSQLSLPLP